MRVQKWQCMSSGRGAVGESGEVGRRRGGPERGFENRAKCRARATPVEIEMANSCRACFIEVLERIETNRFYSRNRSSTSSMFRVIVVYMSKQLRNGPNGYQMKSQLNRQNHGNHNSSANEHQHSPFSREHEPLWPLWPAVKLQLRDASLACAYRPTTCFALVRCASTQGRCLRRVGVSPQ